VRTASLRDRRSRTRWMAKLSIEPTLSFAKEVCPCATELCPQRTERVTGLPSVPGAGAGASVSSVGRDAKIDTNHLGDPTLRGVTGYGPLLARIAADIPRHPMFFDVKCWAGDGPRRWPRCRCCRF
jgi:hypothetical protein